MYAPAPLDAVASLLIAPTLVLGVWNVIPHPVLLTWLALLETAVVMRLALILVFQRRADAENDPTRWIIRYVWVCLLNGMGWGGTVILLAYSPSLVHDALIVLIVAGVLASGLLTLTPVLKAYLAYALPLSLPPILWLLAQDDPLHIIMGVLGLLYLLLALEIARRNGQTLSQSLRLALENSELVESLARIQEQADETRQRQERMAAASQRQQTLLAHAARLNTLGAMASSLVHEINQPITAINLYTEAGLARLGSHSLELNELQEILEKIAAQSTRASAIIQQIRSFARQGKHQYAPVSVHDLLDEIADFLNLEAQRHAIRIRYDASPALPPVLADALQIQQVILNLVRNAIDAMSSGDGVCRIVLAARLDQEMVEITVQDTGPGLEPGIVSQLLHPFFTTKPNGLGLGLPISDSIVEAHGGRLWVTTNPGPGVTFHFTLPVAVGVDQSQRGQVTLSVATG